MEYALDRFEREICGAIHATGQVPEHFIELATPKPNIPADLAFPVFRVAKEQSIAPPQLAQELAATIRVGSNSMIGRIASAGPFLNFSVDNGRLATIVLHEVEQLGPRYGHDDLGQGQTILVEYSSPNMARRMHVGHIRTTIIGQSLFNIIVALGYRTLSDNHIGDWGKNFGVLITAIEHEGRPEGEDETALAALEQLYAKYNSLTEQDPAIDQEARDWSLRLEQGDSHARELWQWIVQMTLSYIQPLYDRLGVRFDTTHGESFFEDKMEPVVTKAIDQQIAYRDEKGAVVVELADHPTFLLQRSDGGTLYHTRDAATIAFREQEYSPIKIIYVVDARQDLHFRQVFALMKALGYVQDTELIHVSFGMVIDSSGQPLAARRGNMVYLQALLDEAQARARTIVEKTSPELSEEEKANIAEAVGVGSVIYNDLYQDPKRNITLDWDRMLALEGNSAPYIQYMHARCRSILRKSLGEDQQLLVDIDQKLRQTFPDYDPTLLNHNAEMDVIKQIAKLPKTTREAGARYAPFVVANWCYDTARALSTFYQECPVLKAETPELRAARLYLVAATAQALKNGLAMLGIRAPERM
ncbi:MAG: arginine--tRNA ligase [Chloroflexota bacterium]